LDLIDYLNESSSSIAPLKDKTCDKIINHFNYFIGHLNDKDKQLLLKIISKSYYKYQDSIKAYENSDYNLINGLLMSILIDQQKQINIITKPR
jgi:hypothetical protein